MKSCSPCGSPLPLVGPGAARGTSEGNHTTAPISYVLLPTARASAAWRENQKMDRCHQTPRRDLETRHGERREFAFARTGHHRKVWTDRIEDRIVPGEISAHAYSVMSRTSNSR